MNESNNKRIAKNTAMLYVRLLITLTISLYTSRVILEVLGIEDFGIYNVVGGVVALFSCFNASMVSATQRFLTFELGKGDRLQLNVVFSNSLLVHIVICLVIILLSETLGLWFLNYKMNIPLERMYAARWIFHLSVITLVISIMNIPYNAMITAHERMKAFAYISVLNVVLKLVVVLMLPLFPVDKLILYGCLTVCISIQNNVVYYLYCQSRFAEARFFTNVLQVPLAKKMLSFAGYSFIGDLAMICNTQGLNVLLNVFFTPVVNAARGIAVQVQGAVANFSSSFQMALNPQITKSYAREDRTYMHQLIIASSKYSFFLLFLPSLPIMIDTEYILQVWLKNVPEHSVSFICWMLPITMVTAMSSIAATSIHATGQIKQYQIVVGLWNLTVLPVAFFVLKLGGNPTSVFVVNFIILLISLGIRLVFLKHSIAFSMVHYFRLVIIPICTVSLFSSLLASLPTLLPVTGLVRFSLICILSLASSLFSIYYLGLTAGERIIVHNKLRSYMQ